jgi:hypothetical protein
LNVPAALSLASAFKLVAGRKVTAEKRQRKVVATAANRERLPEPTKRGLWSFFMPATPEKKA